MGNAKIYFTDMRCAPGDSLLSKMARVMDAAGFGGIDFKRKFAAIKIHFGEPGNLAFLRPNFAKAVADKVKALGGTPFLTDCNTLYVGRRNNAVVHLDAAYENGYSPFSTGCHVIIADGLKGTDEAEVVVEGGEYLKTALIGRAIMDADVIISLNHFKGHELSGFGGAIKNIGMGSGSRAGKMIMHNEGKPYVKPDKCVNCGNCAKFCAHSAFSFENPGKKAEIDKAKCVGCGRCIGVCNFHAIGHSWDSAGDSLSCKMVEYAKAVVSGRPCFHINVVNQVSPYCDCHGESDAAIIPDIGIFAGFDPVALDKACIDAVNAAPAIKTSILSERKHSCNDHFTNVHPNTDWRSQIAHAVKMGLGVEEYELVNVK